MKDMTRGRPALLIIQFAIPILIGNLFQLFYNLADTRIVGSFLGDQALAAVGATGSLNNLIIGSLIGMSNGFAMIPAHSFGAGDRERVRQAVGAIFVLSMAVAAVMTVLTVGLLPQILTVLNTPDDLMPLTTAYFRVILLGLVVTTLYNMCAAVFRAVGDSLTPLLFLIVAALLNVGLDLLFVGPLGMGVEGAALATVLSQGVSVALCLIYARRKYAMLWPRREDLRVPAGLARRLMGAGVSMALMGSIVNIGSVTLQGAINTFGQNIIVAHTAARRLTEMFMLPVSVFGATMATYCSQNLGAGAHARIRRGVWVTLLMSWAGCALVILVCNLAAPLLVQLVTGTTTAEVIDTATLYLRINTLFYAVTAAISILRNALQGVGDRITPLVSSGIEMFGKIAIVCFLTPQIGYMGIILSEPIVWAVMVIPLIVQVLRIPAFRGADAPRAD